jgi:hypothetical protein
VCTQPNTILLPKKSIDLRSIDASRKAPAPLSWEYADNAVQIVNLSLTAGKDAFTNAPLVTVRNPLGVYLKKLRMRQVRLLAHVHSCVRQMLK